MKYSRFEILAMVVAACAVAVTIATTVSTSNLAADIVGQLMILVALAGGLHYGRRGALVAFVMATGTYAIFAFGFRGSMDSSTAMQLFLLRTGVYAVVAIVGGELNVRLKYLFMKLEHQDYVDDITNLYNHIYLSKLIEKHIGEFDRHGTKFALASFAVNPELLKPLKNRKRNRIVKDLGNAVVRGNIRGTDEAARIEGARFSVLFPNTNYDGASSATERIKGRINGYLDRQGLETSEEGTVLVEIHEYPGSRDSLEGLIADLQKMNPEN